MDAIQLNWIPTPLKMMQTCEGWICKTWKWMGACLGLLKIDVGTKISTVLLFCFWGFFVSSRLLKSCTLCWESLLEIKLFAERYHLLSGALIVHKDVNIFKKNVRPWHQVAIFDFTMNSCSFRVARSAGKWAWMLSLCHIFLICLLLRAAKWFRNSTVGFVGCQAADVLFWPYLRNPPYLITQNPWQPVKPCEKKKKLGRWFDSVDRVLCVHRSCVFFKTEDFNWISVENGCKTGNEIISQQFFV